MKFSVCMTNYNTVDVLSQSLNSIISKVDIDEFEIVVLDNESTDGSADVLEDYSQKYENFRFLSKRCLRGTGRQLAFEASSGDVIITADTDTIYNDLWRELINTYIERGFQFGLSSWFSQIYPRGLLKTVGGWSDFQYMEDIELWCRLAKIGKYRTYPIVCGENLKRNPGLNRIERTARRYLRFRDKITMFRHIPFSLYARGYYKVIRDKFTGMKAASRLLYYLSLLSAAELGSRFRRSLREYGDIRYIAENLEDIRIDLGLVDERELVIPKYEFTARQECIRAYREGNYEYLPGFYD